MVESETCWGAGIGGEQMGWEHDIMGQEQVGIRPTLRVDVQGM
jgi:hypothetical protein